MAKREALRELQSRLAERMQAARSQPAGQAWLAVECRGRGLLFPLAQAGEIFGLAPLLPVPHAQPWFCGAANLRGGVWGVVDLGAFLGLGGEPNAAPGEARLIALNAQLGLNCALRIDRLLGLRSAEQLTPDAQGDDNGAPRPAFAGARWCDAQGRRWQELLLAALAEDETFLAIAR
jgi:twitching motility protein PilI